MLSYIIFLLLQGLFCPGVVYVMYYSNCISIGPYHIHSLIGSCCFTKKLVYNVAGNLFIVVKFMFQNSPKS